jgi:hypothetical protein
MGTPLGGVGQAGVLQLLAEGAGVTVGDQTSVVDAGRGCWWWGVGFGVDVSAHPERHGLADCWAVVVDVGVGRVERVEDQPDRAPGQGRVELVEVAVQADRRGLGLRAGRSPGGADDASIAVQEVGR